MPAEERGILSICSQVSQEKKKNPLPSAAQGLGVTFTDTLAAEYKGTGSPGLMHNSDNEGFRLFFSLRLESAVSVSSSASSVGSSRWALIETTFRTTL